MDYGIHMTKELVRRTVINLQFMENALANNQMVGEVPPVFEVTQLLNSMLGAIIIPYESGAIGGDGYWDRLWETTKLQLRTKARLREFGSMTHLARFLRNTFAHGNFQFIPKDNNVAEIILIPRQGTRVQISILDLRTLALALAALILSDGASTILVPAMLETANA